MTPPVVLVAGSGVPAAGVSTQLATLATRTRTGVLNTFCAKGLFRFDDPAHLGTIGLQRDDLALAGVDTPRGARVVAVGVDDAEIPGGIPSHWERVDPHDLDGLGLAVNELFAPRPELYGTLAAVCAPRYGDDSVPLSPARAAGDLAASLPDGAVVAANAGLVGFWLGRTFPTRRPGSVRLPVRATDDVVGEVLGSSDASTAVVVVCGVGDPVPDVGARRGSVVVEHWSPSGPQMSAHERVRRLDEAWRCGGVHHLEVGVALEDIGELVAVAGPVTAWGLALG